MRPLQVLVAVSMLLVCSLAAAQEDLREIELEHRFELGMDGYFHTSSEQYSADHEYLVGITPRFYVYGPLFVGANVSFLHRIRTSEISASQYEFGVHGIGEVGLAINLIQGITAIPSIGAGYSSIGLHNIDPKFNSVLIRPAVNFGYFIDDSWSIRFGIAGYVYSGDINGNDYFQRAVRFNIGVGYTF